MGFNLGFKGLILLFLICYFPIRRFLNIAGYAVLTVTIILWIANSNLAASLKRNSRILRQKLSKFCHTLDKPELLMMPTNISVAFW